jgi:hypothetical protein
LIDRRRVAGLRVVVCQRSRCRRGGRVKFDRLYIFNVNDRTAAAALSSRADQHGELLVFEADYLAPNYVAVLQADSIGKSWNQESKDKRKRSEEAKRSFHRVSPGQRFMMSLQESIAFARGRGKRQLSDALMAGKVVARLLSSSATGE